MTAWQVAQRERALAAGVPLAADPWLFSNDPSSSVPWRRAYAGGWRWKRLRKAAGIRVPDSCKKSLDIPGRTVTYCTSMQSHAHQGDVERRAYTPTQVAAMYGVSPSHIRRLVREGVLNRVPHMGNRVLISTGELDRVFGESAA